VHFIDSLEFFNLFDCNTNFVIDYNIRELCVGCDEDIAVVKFADGEDVNNKLFLYHNQNYAYGIECANILVYIVDKCSTNSGSR
jgi:hypothetical protein